MFATTMMLLDLCDMNLETINRIRAYLIRYNSIIGKRKSPASCEHQSWAMRAVARMTSLCER